MKLKIIAVALALLSSNAMAIGRLSNIDVYDRIEQRNLPIYWHQGKAWVVGSPGNEYQISVRNQAGQDVLAVVSVDGVNVVTGETASTQQGGYVVDAWQSTDISGWRKSLTRTAAFYFTSLSDSYAARTGRPNNVGVIGVAIYRRKAEPQNYAPPPASIAPLSLGSNAQDRAEASAQAAPPASSPAPMRSPGESRADSSREKSVGQLSERLGTGHGRSESSPVRTTSFERATSYPEETVTIYYDSYANLVARGVIREPGWYRQQSEPHAFPGRFVADPPR